MKSCRTLCLYFAITVAAWAQTPPPSTAAPTTAAAVQPDPADLEVTHDVVMGKGGAKDILAEVVKLKDAPKPPTRAIIYVHGGGWSGGTSRQEIGRAYLLARQGYLVTTVGYRLSTEAKWPAQLEDCKLAVRWLRANAAQYGIDPDHIGVSGHSAGAHLVSCLGTMDDPKYEGTGGYAGVSSKVQAVAETSGPVDFTAGNFNDGTTFITDDGKKKGDGMLLLLFGGPFSTSPDVYKDASPIVHVKAGDPPFFIGCGEQDQIVSPQQGKNFAAALQQAGVPVEFYFLKNAIHSLAPAPGGPPTVPTATELFAKMNVFFAKYLGGDSTPETPGSTSH